MFLFFCFWGDVVIIKKGTPIRKYNSLSLIHQRFRVNSDTVCLGEKKKTLIAKTWKEKKKPKITYSDGIGWGRGLGDCYNHKSVSSLNLGTHNWGTARISSCFILTRTYSQTHSDSASTLCPAMHSVCTRTWPCVTGWLSDGVCLVKKTKPRPAWPLTISNSS